MTSSLKGLVGRSTPVRSSPYLPRFEAFDSTAVRTRPQPFIPMAAQMAAQTLQRCPLDAADSSKEATVRRSDIAQIR